MLQRYILGISFAFLLCVAPLAWGASIIDPLQTLNVMQQGIDAADANLVYEAVDVDKVVASSIDDSLLKLSSSLSSGELQGVNPVLLLALSNLDLKDPVKTAMIKGLLSSELRSMLSVGITGGYFAGKPNGKASMQQSAFLEGISEGRKEFIPGKVISRKGDSAIISAVLNDADAGKIPLQLHVEKQQGNWRITGIKNIPQLIDDALKNAR